MESGKIKSFTYLDAWKEGHKLVLMIYKITKSFPKAKTFGLINQLRRAVVSTTSNIAEGFSRKTYKEKLQFYFKKAKTTKFDLVDESDKNRCPKGTKRNKYHRLKSVDVYSMALGSLTEVQNQLLIARDVGYMKSVSFNKISEQSIKVHKIVNGLIKVRKT